MGQCEVGRREGMYQLLLVEVKFVVGGKVVDRTLNCDRVLWHKHPGMKGLKEIGDDYRHNNYNVCKHLP